MIFDQSGSLANVSRHDYLPFGEELFAGARTSNFGYTNADGARQRFTQKERDNETGLDYFFARYYSSTQGRFISPDYFDGNPASLYNRGEKSSALPYASLSDPQTLNSYSYAYNNPLSYVDSDGHKGGKYKPVPGSSGYTYRADVSNMNDSPNLHIFDRRGREIGRVAIKGTAESPRMEWEGNVPSSVQQNTEGLIREQLEAGKWSPRPAPQVEEGEVGPEFDEIPGSKNFSEGVAGLMMFHFVWEAYIEYQQSQRFGYYWNMMGQAAITNLDLARQTLPRGTYQLDGYTFILTKNGDFVGTGTCQGCKIVQDPNGKIRVQLPIS